MVTMAAALSPLGGGAPCHWGARTGTGRPETVHTCVIGCTRVIGVNVIRVAHVIGVDLVDLDLDCSANVRGQFDNAGGRRRRLLAAHGRGRADPVRGPGTHGPGTRVTPGGARRFLGVDFDKCDGEEDDLALLASLVVQTKS